MSKEKPLISIVTPVYNEKENITWAIETIDKKLNYPYEVLVVYDFDEDNTVPVVKKLQKKFKDVRLVKNNLGRGVINAIRAGFKSAKGEIIVVMVPDKADNPNTINKMYRKLQEGYDVVCATRYTKGGQRIGGGALKSTLSRLAGLSTPLILGIPTTDLTNSFKMYKKEVVDNIEIETDGGFEFAMELVVKAHNLGYKISEVPTIWRDRLYGVSRFKLFKWLPKYGKLYLMGIKFRLQRLLP